MSVVSAPKIVRERRDGRTVKAELICVTLSGTVFCTPLISIRAKLTLLVNVPFSKVTSGDKFNDTADRRVVENAFVPSWVKTPSDDRDERATVANAASSILVT